MEADGRGIRELRIIEEVKVAALSPSLVGTSSISDFVFT